MKKKGLLSIFLMTGIVVSVFGIAYAGTSNVFISNGQKFSWEFDQQTKNLSVSYAEGDYEIDEDAYVSVAADVKTMDIFTAPKTPYNYKYSGFTDGLDKLEKITVTGNLFGLTIGNKCPNLKEIAITQNRNTIMYFDLSNRTSSVFPTITVDELSYKYWHMDFTGYNGSNSSITVPAAYGMSVDNNYTFRNSSSIQKVTFANGTKDIPNSSFYNCENLSEIIIPNTVTYIEYKAFYKCKNLKSVIIPNSVECICFDAFEESGITDISYIGTREQWYGLVEQRNYDNSIIEGSNVLYVDGATVHCQDGDIYIYKTDTGAKIPYVQVEIGWEKIGNKWYYMRETGQYACNTFLTINGKTYRFGNDCTMHTGWFQFENDWLFFDRLSGEKLSNCWLKDNGNWYYLDEEGRMVTGWLKSGNVWYYLSESGAMVTNWKQIDGVWYFFKSNGAMAANEWCGGYWLIAYGSWTYPYKASWYQNSKGWWYGDTSGWYAKNATYRIDGKDYNFDSNGYCTNPY